MTNPILAVVGLLTLLHAQPAQAQERCGGDAPVADLGITISCDCTLNNTRSREWVFRSPIVVNGVDASGASRGRLRAGDRIVAVNGQSITSEAGARALMSLAPGRAARLTIERGEETMQVEVTPGSMCPRERDAFGSYAPAPVVPPPPPGARGGTPAPPAAPRALPSPAPAPRARSGPDQVAAPPAPPAPTPAPDAMPPAPPTPAVPMTPDLIPEGWLGFGLTCSECGMERERGDTAPRWEFTSPPVVYGIEPGGPAAAGGLREDDRITHVNGFVVTDRRAGAALGGVRPGQTLRLRVERAGGSREVEVTARRRPGAPTPTQAPPPAAPPAPASLRYEGRIGDVAIAVRGSEPVGVEVRRDTNEVVIRTATTVVTLKLED